jgi:hypothetical protein
MKAIKIKSCDDCPYSDIGFCEHSDTPSNFIIKKHIQNKTLPEECMLEEDNLHRITKQKIWELWKMISQT